MKIAFVNLELGGGLSGVSKAVAGQARAARREGLPIDFIVVNPARDGVVGDIRFVQYAKPPLGPRTAVLFKARLLARAAALREYDVILLRYPGALDLDPLALLRTATARIITVHHTNEVAELLSAKRSPGMLGRAAYEWAAGPRVLARVAAIVGVTDEIRDYQTARARRQMPSRTIANGIDVANVAHTRFVPFDGRELKMVFVASARAPWHGLDRLMSALRTHRGQPRVTLELVGGGTGAPRGTVERYENATIRHHGPLDGEALDRVFTNVTLAVSSLALFRAGLRQACVLKTRDYVSRGIPFIYAYDDVDLAADLPFALRLPNDGTELPMGRVFEFAKSVSRTPEVAFAMRRFAETNLDWSVKMKTFHEFATSVGNRRL